MKDWLTEIELLFYKGLFVFIVSCELAWKDLKLTRLSTKVLFGSLTVLLIYISFMIGLVL